MIACVLIPYFSAAIEQRERSSPRRSSLVIVDAAAKVLASCRQANQAGLKPGMTIAQARMLCPKVAVIPADDRRYQAALAELLSVLREFADRVELDDNRQTALSWLEIGPLTRAGAAGVGESLGRRVLDRMGLKAAIGLASGKFPAYTAAVASKPNKVLVIAAGREAAFLAPFSVELLPVEAEIIHRLKVLGIRQLGQLAALPAGAVLTQFGQVGRLLHQLAQGRDNRPLAPPQQQLTQQITYPFDSPVVNQLVLTAILGAMARELAGRLAGCSRLGRSMRLRLHLENGTTVIREIVLRRPTGQAERLAQTLRDLLSRVEVRSGVTEVGVTITDSLPAVGQQLDLFFHQRQQVDRLQQVLPDLLARYGTGCFYQASLLDELARLPERRFRLWAVEAE